MTANIPRLQSALMSFLNGGLIRWDLSEIFVKFMSDIPSHILCGLCRVAKFELRCINVLTRSGYCRHHCVFLIFDSHYSDYFPTQILSVGVCYVWDLRFSRQCYADFSFAASEVVPVHGMKACEGVYVLCILDFGNGSWRCATLTGLTDTGWFFRY